MGRSGTQRYHRADDELGKRQKHDLPPQSQRRQHARQSDDRAQQVAGTAAIAQVATPPYTSMRLACASNIIAAMSTRLAIRLPHGWRLRPMPRSTLPLVIQITDGVEPAQEPVVGEVPVYVPEEVPVYVPLDPAYAAVLVLVILDWSKVMRAPP